MKDKSFKLKITHTHLYVPFLTDCQYVLCVCACVRACVRARVNTYEEELRYSIAVQGGRHLVRVVRTN